MDGVASSTTHFVLAMVQLPGRGELPELAAIRQALHLPTTFEFKYHSAKARQKEVFFAGVRTLHLGVRAVVLRKEGLEAPLAGLTGDALTVELIAGLAARAAVLGATHDVLIIDGAGPALRRALRIRLSAESRRLGLKPPFHKIVGADSDGEDGLQLADMVAGAIRQHAVGAKSDWFASFANKVVDLWWLPEPGQ
jgi:hypothetical protein